MLNETILQHLNSQVNMEFYSSYVYFSMALYFKDKGLNGLEKLMKQHANEELEHASKLIDYIYQRNAQVRLEEIKAPNYTFSTAFDIFETAWEHEKLITKSLSEIFELAEKEKDPMTSSFVQKYIDEQIEEENFFLQFTKKCSLLKEDKLSLIVFDNLYKQ